MKNIISALVATSLLGSVVLADEIDDKIQRLEKENKLLELQKKKRELEMQNQIINKNDNSTPEYKTAKSVNPNSKSGAFIGIEGVLGGTDINFSVSEVDIYSSEYPDRIYDVVLPHKLNITFDMGLVGGYQHYFGESQRHGIKVSAHLYSGFGNNYNMLYDPPVEVINYSYETQSSDGAKMTVTNTGTAKTTGKVIVSYIPIKFGFDVKYLWDFLQRGKHTLGLNVGLGYEFDAYINGKEKVSSIYDSETKNSIDAKVTQHHDEDQKDYKLDNIYSNGIYPVIGLHYYYGHHQFELMYRFGGIFDQVTSKNAYHDSDSDTFNGKNGLITETTDETHKIVLNTQSYLTINYAYRF